MRIRVARISLILSVVVLVAVAVAWRSSADEQPRADLVDAPRSSVTLPPAPNPTTTAPTATKSGTPFRATSTPPALPRRIQIPALGVDAPVVDVGLEDDGSMEIPGVAEAGWYRNGPRPGAPFGSAVIAAHIDYADQPGVFFDLPKLALGEPFAVTDERGTPRFYVVTERFQVTKDQLPVDELFRTSGPETLTLITCGGIFDTSERRYQDNIVVRAVPA